MSAASDGDGGKDTTGVGSSLTTLVPTFDPSKDNLKIYQQKVELVLAAWPKSKITELVMRLILNCQGSAFAKLQLHQSELMENDEKSVKRLVELLGGHWGRIGLERQYEEAEQAIFNTCQLKDESNDSYLARSDIAWSKFLSQKLSMSDLQAFVLLRGSTLTPEEKKRVILESDNSLEGKLTVGRVSEAVRILGATFFQEMTGQKAVSKQKVYSAADTLLANQVDDEDFGLHAQDELGEDEFVECLVNEGDDDATLVADFEAAASEVLQEDPELAGAYSAYTEARKRLSEKFKNRGFWATSVRTSSTSKGKSGSFKGHGKGKPMRPRRSLQDRIMNSYCRNCNRKGHWKAECPYKAGGPNQSTATGGSTGSSVPATAVTIDQLNDVLPLEFMDLPDAHPEAIDDALPVLVCDVNYKGARKPSYYSGIHGESTGNSWDSWERGPSAKERLQIRRLRNEHHEHAKRRLANTMLRQRILPVADRCHTCADAKSPHPHSSPSDNTRIVDVTEATVCFATHGSHGILDLGASKTVIGSDHVAELINSFNAEIHQQLTKCKCNITFRFGNQGTLSSQYALVVPIGPLKLKIAVVSGGTPFLISNTLMRAIEAKIDCSTRTLTSHLLTAPMPLQLTSKGLFLLDVNLLIMLSQRGSAGTDQSRKSVTAETFMSEEAEAKQAAESRTTEVVNPIPDVIHRLRALQIPATTSAESLEHLTLEQLSGETIGFGQKHQGHTMLEAWEDQEWVQFMISRYQGSTKDTHRRFLRFVELMVEDLEKNQVVLPKSSQQGGSNRPRANPKAVAKSIATPSHISLPDGEDDWDLDPEMLAPMTMGYASDPMVAENMAALQARMLNMEDALGRVIKHIEDQALKNNQDQ
eukprot:s12_g40.t1